MREAGEKNSQGIERPARERNHARPFSIQPKATEKRGNAQHKNADRERQRYFRNTPAELLRERDTKNAPGINRTQRDLEKHSRDCDYPAIIRTHRLIILALLTASLLVSYRGSLCRCTNAPWMISGR